MTTPAAKKLSIPAKSDELPAPVAATDRGAAVAVFQGVVVPSAGTIAVVWLSVGGLLFLTLFDVVSDPV